MGNLFGTDGIRGVANTYPLDVETAAAAGRAVAHYFNPDMKGRRVILIGQDTRLSGDMIVHAVSAGICSAGCDVSMLGVMPTPALAYLTRSTEAIAGIVISASHNPYADNGIKLFNSNGYKLSDAQESEIEHLIGANEPAGLPALAASSAVGRVQAIDVNVRSYLKFLEGSVAGRSLAGLKIVLDCANGATFTVAPRLFQQMGAEVTSLFCTPDGVNINAGCGSQHPQTLSRTVVEQGADLGLAFDGDGDRLIAVDESGRILTGDQVIAICARHLRDNGQLAGNRVVTTVMSNMGLHKALKNLGIDLVTSQVGDRHVMQDMLACKAVLGGEDSGHIIFHDRHTTGDGIMAALRLIDAMQASGQRLSELARIMTVFPQVLINVDVDAKPDLAEIPQVMDAIRGVEASLAGEGRVLVRYSGTQNQCRVMVEGPSQDLTQTYCRQIADVVRSALAAG